MFRGILIFILLAFHFTSFAGDSTLLLKKVIRGGLSPKSVVHSGTGLFFAQNMMYSHTVRVYNRDYELVKIISDKIKPKDFGIDTIEGSLIGSPVEVAFSHKGKYAWVSNYNMSGDKFTFPGCDSCHSDKYDKSFLYKINTETLLIEEIIAVGAVPKYVAVSPNDKYVLVSNWSSGDISIVDVEKSKEIKRVKAGRFPRGIVVDSKSEFAYATVMGGTNVLKIDLADFSTTWIKNVGRGPRHLCISSDDSMLYVSLNTEGKIAKIDLHDGTIEKLACGGSPRSMVITPDDKFLYVVNYSVDKLSKVDLQEFKVTEQHVTKDLPIGITFDSENNEVWVACYSGVLMIYRDTYYKGGSEWHDYFNVKEQLNYVFDYIGKVSEDFFTASNEVTKKEEVKVVTKLETRNTKPETKKTPTVETKKAITSSTKPETINSKPETTTGKIYIIVGSFKTESNATKLAAGLKAKGYSATTFKNKNGLTYSAVGGFTNEQSAKDTLEKIKSKEGIDAWIYRL